MAAQDEKNWLNGKLLLAMPAMGDPRFYKAVIYVCAHDANGAMGLIVNHRLPGLELPELLKQLGIASDIRVAPEKIAIPVLSGGPVEMGRGFLLHSSDFRRKDTIEVGEGVSVTATVEGLRDVAIGQGPEKLLFILGYAGWSAGQLEKELQENAWLVLNPDPEIIFEAENERKWDLALSRLGIDPAMLSAEAGRA